MSTTYKPAGALERGAPLPFASTRYTGAAALHAAILAAAALAPEVSPVVEFRARYLADKYPHTEPGQHETGAALYMRGRDACTIRGGAVFALQLDTDGPACYWPRVDVHPEAPGPFLPLPSDARAVFAYATPDGARGVLTVENLRAPLLALADKVHAKRALFDGKTRRASCPPAVAGSKSSAPHVAARGFWESGQYAEALHLARNVGALFFGASGNEPGAHPYMAAESHEVAGHGFTLARSIRSGRFRVLHTRTGLACDTATAGAPRSDGFSARGAALDWLESSAACEAWRARLNAAASKAAEFSQAAALAFYLADEPADEPSEAEAAAPATQTTPEAPEAAAPIVAAPEGLASAPAAPGAWARPAAGLLSEAEARGFEALAQTAREAFEARHVAAGLLARFGVSDPAACAHLAAFGPELARIQAEAAAAWEAATNPDPEPGAPGASAPARRCSVPGMGGAVYRAHCATYARARALQGLAPIVGGHAAALDFADPLQLFRAFARFRNPAANALRADVARSIRAERVAARVVAARMLTPTRGISTAAPAPLPRESESCTGLAAWAETARAESSARRETAVRLAAGAEFPELAGGSVRFSYPSDPARFGLAGPDMSGADAFRFTYFDAAGPAGHAGALTLAEACAEALSRGYLPIAPEVDPVQVADPLPGKLERPAYANQWQAWDEVRAERGEPDAYQAAVIECMGAAKARGLFYNAETYPDAAAQMAARGYPDWRETGADNGVAREFGTDCYLAGDVLKLRALKAENKAAADALKLGPLPVLMFSDYKRCTGAVLHSFEHTGQACRVTFKRGRSAFETTCTAAQLKHAIERAAERAGRLAEERERRKPAAPLATHSAPAPDLAALILAAVAARESALTPAGLKEYGTIPAELAAIERAARELVAAGRLGCFEYSGQAAPAFYLPIKAEAPATEAAPDPVPGKSEARGIVADYGIAHAAGTDAGNRSMRAAGRTAWSAEDFDAAAETMQTLVGPVPGQSAPVPAMQAARVAAVLDKLIRCEGEVMTRREFIARKVADGLALSIEQHDRIKPLTRMQAFRASNEEQREHDRKVKAAGQKPVYFLGGFEVTKIEHDHAAELIAARVPAESTASAPAVSSEPEAKPAEALHAHERPCAAEGLTSYRCRGMWGWIMIGATDADDALREARRSSDAGPAAVKPETLEVWDGTRYVPTAPAPGIDGLDVAELGADALAAFEAPPAAPPRDAEREALRERARAAVAGFTPSLRIPAGDPRLRIPARFAPVYVLAR